MILPSLPGYYLRLTPQSGFIYNYARKKKTELMSMMRSSSWRSSKEHGSIQLLLRSFAPSMNLKNKTRNVPLKAIMAVVAVEEMRSMGMTRMEKELRTRTNAGPSNKENTSPKYSMNHEVAHPMTIVNLSASHITSEAFAQPTVPEHTISRPKLKKQWRSSPKPADPEQKQRKR